MSQATSPSANRPYGIQRVCRAWRMARATVQRHKSQSACEPAKRGPKGFMSDEALLGEIRREHHILAHERHTGIRGPETHDRTITTDKPDLMWAIDAIECLRVPA